MRRRAFVAGLGSAVATPWIARAQQQRPLVGFIGLTSFDEWRRYVLTFHQGLKETGYSEGQNVAFEYRWAEGRYESLASMAADLAARKVDVIVAVAPPAALAAKTATTSIPVVFFMGADPVKLGVVASLNRPGGNITGVSALANAIGVKRLQLLREIAPKSETSGLLVNPTNQNAELDTREIQEAAETMKQPLLVAKASTDAHIDAAFATFAERKVGALVVNPDPFLLGRRARIVALARQGGIATVFHTHEPVVDGGLMSYGASFTEAHRHVGRYTGQILNGAKPADLPILQSGKFELTLNLRTAKALGLDVPPSLLGTADELIE